jgi:hypothetical protein
VKVLDKDPKPAAPLRVTRIQAAVFIVFFAMCYEVTMTEGLKKVGKCRESDL